jgi:hypothetical protein
VSEKVFRPTRKPSEVAPGALSIMLRSLYHGG